MKKLAKKMLKKIVLAVRSVENELDGTTPQFRPVSQRSGELIVDYMYRDVINDEISVRVPYNRLDWYVTKRNVAKFDSVGIDINSDNVRIYAAYRERNCSFDVPGTGGFSLEPGKYVVCFNIASSANVGARIFVHAYSSDGMKEELVRLDANNMMAFEVKESHKNLRLSAQVWGNGRIQFDTIEFLKVDNNLKISSSGASEAYANSSSGIIPMNENRNYLIPSAFIGDLWYKNNKSIVVNGDTITATENLSKAFLSYLDDNCGFKLPPENPIEIGYSHCKVGFYGKSEGVDAELCIIGYAEGEKKFLFQVPLNSEQVLFCPEGIEARVALKVSGKGSLRDIKIEVADATAKKKDIINKIKANAKKMPSSPLVGKKGSPYKIGVIFDEFTFECFKSEADYVVLTPDNFREQIEQEKPDFIMVESTWNGNGGLWKDMVSYIERHEQQTLKMLIEFCKARGIKTVFWNKEDPVNFECFIEAAKLFDVVFTTDNDIVPKYKELVGHENVYALPFAANPSIHNPIGRRQARVGSVAFAGSWMVRHEDRMTDMLRVLGPAVDYDLTIFDRNYNKVMPSSYRFPDPYAQFVAGALPFELMSKAYRMYDIFLNVNSIQHSTTMFSRRVFELLASGTAVVTGYALGIDTLLKGLTLLCNTEEETKNALEMLINNPEIRERLIVRGIRDVMEKHTYFHRFSTILDKVGLKSQDAFKRNVTFVGVSQSPEDTQTLINIFEAQSGCDNKELIIVLPKNISVSQKLKEIPNVKFAVCEGNELAQVILNNASYGFVSLLSAQSYYGAAYARDMLTAFIYSDAAVVGKSAYFEFNKAESVLYVKNYTQDFNYAKAVNGKTLVFRKPLLERVGSCCADVNELSNWIVDTANRNELPIYSSDRFNYCQLTDGGMNLANDKFIAFTDSFEKSVNV